MDLVMNHTLFSLEQEYSEPSLEKLGYAMISGEQGHLKINGKSPFGRSWVYYQPLLSNHWSVGVAVDEDYLMRDVYAILMIQTVASVLIFFFVAIIIYARVLNVSRPLKRLALAADQNWRGFLRADPESDNPTIMPHLQTPIISIQASLRNTSKTLGKLLKEEPRSGGM
jgi:hypothetical protein